MIIVPDGRREVYSLTAKDVHAMWPKDTGDSASAEVDDSTPGPRVYELEPIPIIWGAQSLTLVADSPV